jgi:hypothetical protein
MAVPGSVLSPLARAACWSLRAISAALQPRDWRCWRSHNPRSSAIAVPFVSREWGAVVSVIAGPRRLRVRRRPGSVS